MVWKSRIHQRIDFPIFVPNAKDQSKTQIGALLDPDCRLVFGLDLHLAGMSRRLKVFMVITSSAMSFAGIEQKMEIKQRTHAQRQLLQVSTGNRYIEWDSLTFG